MASKKPEPLGLWFYVAMISLVANCVLVCLPLSDHDAKMELVVREKDRKETCEQIGRVLDNNMPLHEAIWALQNQVKIDKLNLSSCMKANKRLQERIAHGR